jgi:hypothetical protein
MHSKSNAEWIEYYIGMPIPIHNIIKSYLVQHSGATLSSNIIETLSTQIKETIESYFKDNYREDLEETSFYN